MVSQNKKNHFSTAVLSCLFLSCTLWSFLCIYLKSLLPWLPTARPCSQLLPILSHLILTTLKVDIDISPILQMRRLRIYSRQDCLQSVILDTTLYHLTSILRFYCLCFHSSGLGYGESEEEEWHKSKRTKTDLGSQPWSVPYNLWKIRAGRTMDL